MRVEQREIPPELLAGDYAGDPTFRARMQDWINALWEQKDALIRELQVAA